MVRERGIIHNHLGKNRYTIKHHHGWVTEIEGKEEEHYRELREAFKGFPLC